MRKFALHASLGLALILACLVPAHLQENLPAKLRTKRGATATAG